MTVMAVLTLLVVTVSATITPVTSASDDSCPPPSTNTIIVSRDYLASWLENSFSLDWEEPQTDGECGEVLGVSQCSWGPCEGGSDYTGPGSLTLQDGSSVRGRVEAGILSGPVNISQEEEEEEESPLQAWLLPAGCLTGLVRRDYPAGQRLLAQVEGGQLVGPVWLVDPDNVGHLYTELPSPQSPLALSLSLLTGPEVLWLYPDLSTALR